MVTAMRETNEYKIAFLLITLTFCGVIIYIVHGMAQTPTTEENRDIREEAITLVGSMLTLIAFILGYNLGGKANNDKKD